MSNNFQNSDGTWSFKISRDGDNIITPHVVTVGSGTAGSPGTSVTTVQGITNGTPVPVLGPLTDTQLRATPISTLASGRLVMVSGVFTRPADTTGYTAGDVVSNSTSTVSLLALAGAFRSAGGTSWLTGFRLITNLKSITPRFRVHLFSSAPTAANQAVDNLPYKALYADVGLRLGSFDLPAMFTPADVTNSNISGTMDLALRIPLVGTATSLQIMLEALDGFTPASGQSFTAIGIFDQN